MAKKALRVVRLSATGFMGGLKGGELLVETTAPLILVSALIASEERLQRAVVCLRTTCSRLGSARVR